MAKSKLKVKVKVKPQASAPVSRRQAPPAEGRLDVLVSRLVIAGLPKLQPQMPPMVQYLLNQAGPVLPVIVPALATTICGPGTKLGKSAKKFVRQVHIEARKQANQAAMPMGVPA